MSQPRLFHRRLGVPESLEPRQLLTSSGPALVAEELQAERTLTLAARHDVALSQQAIELVNPTSDTARFSFTINGHLSRNTAHLVEQIRGMTLLGDEQMPDYQRAYYYLMQFHQHDFPFSTGLWTHEPSFYLNSIGSGLCDDASTVLKLLWEEMGYESRIWLLNGHVVSEVFTGERWEMYDADLKVFYHNHQGQVAGVEELAANPDLIYAPVDPTSANSFVYSGRVSSIYSTTENNKVCTVCDDFVVPRDLIFSVPSGGSLAWGQTYSDRILPTIILDTPTKLGQLKLTIPSGFSGSIDIPLALLDVLGAAGDEVRIGQDTLTLGGEEPFDFFNQEQYTGNRFHRLEVDGNEQPIEIVFLLNQRFAEVLDTNQVVIQAENQAATRLSGRVTTAVATRWATDPAQEWLGAEHMDLSGTQVAGLLKGQSAFEVRARVQVEQENVRRPIFDAFRFSLEIDAQQRPYVYYRQANGSWIGLRGAPLAAGEWQDIAARYDHGALTLEVNGEVVARTQGDVLSETYALRGPYLGKSDHLGGLFFQGRMDFVQVRELHIPDDAVREVVMRPEQEFPDAAERGGAVAENPVAPQLLEIISKDRPLRRRPLYAEGVDALLAGSYRFV